MKTSLNNWNKFKLKINKATLIKLCLLLVSFVIGLILFETTFFLYNKLTHSSAFKRLWKSNTVAVFIPAPDITPGINGLSTFTINSMGIRGREISKSDSYRILCVGGSTTECFSLDDREVWTHLLEKKLGNCYPNLWVGNLGISGMTLGGGLPLTKRLTRQLEPLDMLIVLAGINDLSKHIKSKRDKYDVKKNYAMLHRFLSGTKSVVGGTVAFNLLGNLLNKKSERSPLGLNIIKDELGRIIVKAEDIYIDKRNARSKATLISEIPDLEQGLSKYENEINRTIDFATEKGIKLCFITQPTLWKIPLNQQEQQLLWFGWSGYENKYYSVESLYYAITEYNNLLKKVCKSRDIDCIDLAEAMPDSKDLFYDDCHFTELGAVRAAEIIAGYILENGLIKVN